MFITIQDECGPGQLNSLLLPALLPRGPQHPGLVPVWAEPTENAAQGCWASPPHCRRPRFIFLPELTDNFPKPSVLNQFLPALWELQLFRCGRKVKVQERPHLHHSLGNSFNDLCFLRQRCVVGDGMRDKNPESPQGVTRVRTEIIAQVNLKYKRSFDSEEHRSLC